MEPRDLLTGEDDLAGTPAWHALQWRARQPRPAPRMPYGLRKIRYTAPSPDDPGLHSLPGAGQEAGFPESPSGRTTGDGQAGTAAAAPLRLKAGIFAGIHGDEPAGTLATQELAAWARRHPAELAGWHLDFFPVCNPTGLRARTRHCRSGMDLNREFWNGSDQPEVRALERELRAGCYDLIISLHEDDTSDGVYGFAGGTLLSREVLEPALAAASAVLPRNNAPVIDGFPAEKGIITGSYRGILSAPPEQRPRALEIVFETPALAPRPRRVAAAIIAVKTILTAFRSLQIRGRGI